MLLSFLDRFKNKLVRMYRKAVFLDTINCSHKDLYIVGDYTLINHNITLGHNVTVYPGVMFFGQGPIVLGNNVNIGNGTVFYSSSRGGITIGDNTMIAAHCYLIDSDHGISAGKAILDQEDTVEKIEIGEDVWLAAGVKVLKGSKIGKGAIIGANAVVKSSIPENSVAVGVPAAVRKYRK